MGARAEALAAERAAALAAEKETKRAAKASARGTRSASPRERTPDQQLKRLQRALAKRKTLAGRQSVQRQIDALLRERDA